MLSSWLSLSETRHGLPLWEMYVLLRCCHGPSLCVCVGQACLLFVTSSLWDEGVHMQSCRG